MNASKTVIGLGFVAFALNAVGVDVDGYHVWLSNGTGTWRDVSRWEGGDVPTSSGSKVRITGTASVTDDDFVILDNCSKVLLDVPSACLVFENANEAHVASQIVGSGSIVKDGVGDLHFDCTDIDGLRTSRGMVVNKGNLYLPSSSSDRRFGPIAVNSPGVLYVVPTGNTIVEGLSGDGTILNPSETRRELKFNCPNPNGLNCRFEGTIGEKIDLTLENSYQELVRTGDSTSRNFRLQSGLLGVNDLGPAEGPDALGSGILSMRGNSNMDYSGIRYLGTGGVSSKQIYLYDDNKSMVLDGGPYGGLVLTGSIRLSYNSKIMSRVILDGSNTQACVIGGAFLDGADLSTYVIKRGTGVWRFGVNPATGKLSGDRTCRGVFAVERGAIEFDSIAEAGSLCALGYQNILHGDYIGSRDDAKAVPYAFLLGDGSTNAVRETGTLSYIGVSDGACGTRPIALKGAGRLRNDGAGALAWAGVTAGVPGNHVLVLDGAGTENVIRDVTNGVGKVGLVKEGSGTWTVDGNMDLSGGLDVRGGTLELRNDQRYRWYRLNVKETWSLAVGQTDNQLMIEGFALMDEAGNQLTKDFTHETTADGNPSVLSAGKAAIGRTGYTLPRSDRALGNLFADDTSIFNIYYNNVMPTLKEPSTWVSIVVRLPDDAATVAKYDIRACNGTGGGKPYMREVMSWSIEGSCDGVSWTELVDVVSNATKDVSAVAQYSSNKWYSSKDTTSTGYALAGESTRYGKMSAVDYVKVSGNGVLRTDRPVMAKELRIDAAALGGTIDGFSFSEDVNVVIEDSKSLAPDGELPVKLIRASGLANLNGVVPVVDGKTRANYSLSVRDDKLYLLNPGLILLLR